nr:porin family protein [uncultured Shewanella sp.]
MKKIPLVALAITAMTASVMANAATDRTGFYVGGELGAVSAKAEGETESGQSYGVYGGYNFNEWFGLEGTLYATNDLIDNQYASVNAAAFSVTPKFTLVLNDTFSLYGKVGISSVAVVIDAPFSDIDYSGFGITLGAGVNAALTESLNLRLGYDYTPTDLDSDDFGAEDFDVDFSRVTLGMHYQF